MSSNNEKDAENAIARKILAFQILTCQLSLQQLRSIRLSISHLQLSPEKKAKLNLMVEKEIRNYETENDLKQIANNIRQTAEDFRYIARNIRKLSQTTNERINRSKDKSQHLQNQNPGWLSTISNSFRNFFGLQQQQLYSKVCQKDQEEQLFFKQKRHNQPNGAEQESSSPQLYKQFQRFQTNVKKMDRMQSESKREKS